MFYLPLLIVALLFALAVDKDHFFSCLSRRPFSFIKIAVTFSFVAWLVEEPV